MFSEHEWQLLLANDTFTLNLRNAGNTLDDVERLSILGEQIIHSSHVKCETASTDPAKHAGPFKTTSVAETETSVLSNEECISCGGPIRRVTTLVKPKAAHTHTTLSAASTSDK